MDEFQKAFFLFRQSEWEDYKRFHESVMQGDLEDPVYFDFISFCQYVTISNKIRQGLFQFVEKVCSHVKLSKLTVGANFLLVRLVQKVPRR